MSIWLSSLQRLKPGVQLPALPAADLLMVTSSGEIGMLAAPSSKDWLRALIYSSPHAHVHMVSIGCAGVVACVLEFMHSSANLAHVLVTESPPDWVQSTLDAAGVGAGGDGFKAQDIAYVLTLTRSAVAPTTDSVKLLYSSLLSRNAAMGGTAQLAARFANIVIDLHQQYSNLSLVRFDNGSQWSHHLDRLVDVLVQRQGLPGTQDWLDSVECDLRHYMCARPLLDWQAHAGTMCKAPLLLSCLGAGGRLGLLVIGSGALQTSGLLVHPPLPMDIAPPHANWWRGEHDPPRDVLYVKSEYFGIQQFYFRWRLTREHLWST
jgi:hypothetical protein